MTPPTPDGTETCGTCAGCRLRAEVTVCLAYVYAKMIPPYRHALEELQAARRASTRRAVLDAYSKIASRRKAEWMAERERFLTPEVCRWSMCEWVPFLLTRQP